MGQGIGGGVDGEVGMRPGDTVLRYSLHRRPSLSTHGEGGRLRTSKVVWSHRRPGTQEGAAQDGRRWPGVCGLWSEFAFLGWACSQSREGGTGHRSRRAAAARFLQHRGAQRRGETVCEHGPTAGRPDPETGPAGRWGEGASDWPEARPRRSVSRMRCMNSRVSSGWIGLAYPCNVVRRRVWPVSGRGRGGKSAGELGKNGRALGHSHAV